jgi:hypothetical protein
MPIRGYLEDKTDYEPEAVHAMSQAFDQACTALDVTAPNTLIERSVVAARIMGLARIGMIDTSRLRDQALMAAQALRSA